MKTRGSGARRRERNRLYYEKHCQTVEKREESRKKVQECRKRKREEERVLSNRHLASQEKFEELKKALKKRKFPCLEELDDHEIVQETLEQVHDQPAEKSEDDEEIKKSVYSEMEVLCEAYARDEAACKGLTSMDPCKFDAFVVESAPALDATTYRGNQ